MKFGTKTGQKQRNMTEARKDLKNKQIKFDSWESFWKKVKPMLGPNRMDSFQMVFDHLDKVENPSIVETGTYRMEGNIAGDGMSTVLFDTYIDFHGGKGVSIDIDKYACSLAHRATRNFQIMNENSLTALGKIETKADLLYLDSFDVDWKNHLPAAIHHLKELFSARDLLKKGTLIVIDDNLLIEGTTEKKRIGKGEVVLEYMNDIGMKPLFDAYQIGWIWK